MIGNNRNLWSRFHAAAGGASYQVVGDCTAAGFGTCTLQLPGGAEIQAQGAGTVGHRYFVKDSVLGAEAPLAIEV